MTITAGSATGLRERLALQVPSIVGPRPHALTGAWHPRNTDLESQLPELVAAIAEELGPIERVLFHLDEWQPAPRRIVVGTRVVRLYGYLFQPTHTVTIRTSDDTRVVLLVIPPSTSNVAAQSILRHAGLSGGTETVQEPPGSTPSDSAPFTDPTGAEQRWDTDGGAEKKRREDVRHR